MLTQGYQLRPRAGISECAPQAFSRRHPAGLSLGKFSSANARDFRSKRSDRHQSCALCKRPAVAGDRVVFFPLFSCFVGWEL